ncbi:MAG TPA: rhodanese-like domain-containing protein [Labilithrix sp.]|jgi:thiosulfate/3-mercaptopyruvate sulfurtransferase|nr:rhodanese-like domain-containing protein [Labilithrix sp.]
MNAASSWRTNEPEVATSRWVSENLGATWLRILDVRSTTPVRDDRSGTRLHGSDDPPRFVELGPRGGWLRAGTWPKSTQAPAAFLRGHLPNSVLFDVGARLFDETGVLVSAPEFAMAMSESGVGDEHTVVLVDDEVPTAALVAAWALRRYGHHDTLILAGGFPRWTAEGRPVAREVIRHPYASFTARTSS